MTKKKKQEDEINFYEEVGLVDLLDHALIEDNEKTFGGIRKFNPIRPSASGKCERAMAYEYHEYHNGMPATQEDRAANVIRLLSIGLPIERAIIGHMYKLKEPFDIHVKYKDQKVTVAKLKDGTLVEGEIDWAIESEKFNLKMLLDAKTTKEKFSSHMATNWEEILKKWEKSKYVKKVSDNCFLVTDTYKFVKELKDDFKSDNILQLNMYLGSHFFQERGYEYASLQYYRKNTSLMHELRFKFCPKLQAEVTAKYQSAYDNGKSSPDEANKTFWFGSIRCAFCPYKERCWTAEADPKYAYFQTLPKKYWPKDTSKIKDGKKLEKMFKSYENSLNVAQDASTIELEIAKALYDKGIGKVKLENGNVYEVKLLKTKGLVLRRSKV